MSHSNVTATEALRRLLAATKLIDYADCKDETVWQALGAAQGTAEGVLRDGEKQEPVKIGYDHPKFERYAFNMGCRDFEASDYSEGYANPHTQLPWNFWKASRDAISSAPQPAAAPSGDVEREETDCEWIHAPPNKPGIYLHRHPVYKGVDKKVFVGWVSASEPLNQGIKRPQYAIHMRVCPVDEPLHMDRLTPEAWGGVWKKVDAETKE